MSEAKSMTWVNVLLICCIFAIIFWFWSRLPSSELSYGELGDEWTESYEEAVQESRETGRPILADFTGSDWCPPCQMLKSEVFATSEFKDWASEHVVLLELDFPRSSPQTPAISKQNKDLAARYNVNAFPTVLFLNADGKPLGQAGYRRGGPKAWIESVSSIVSGS